MPEFQSKTLYDALNEMEGGANLGDSPLDLPANVMAGASNTSVRGKNVTHRPPYQNRPVTYVNVSGQISATKTAVQTGVFQGCTEEVVLDDTGNAFVIALISGRVFSFAISGNTVTCTELLIYTAGGSHPAAIQGGSVTNATITNANITGATITVGSITSGAITGATITGATLVGGTITTGTVTGGTITSTAGANAAITGNPSITTGFLITGTITDVSIYPSNAVVCGPSATTPQAWLWQTECWVIINDGATNPIVVNLNTQIATRSAYGGKVEYTTTLTSSPTTGGPGSTFVVGFTSVLNLSVGQYCYVYNQGTFLVTAINGLDVTMQTISSVGYLSSGQTVYWFGVGGGLQPGRMGAYGIGRNWYALIAPTQFLAGDIDGGSSGTPAYNFRDAVLQSTENSFIVGGGTFCIPGSHGPITAIKFSSQENVVDGQGPLMVFSRKSVYSCQAPVDRLTWQSVTNPILTTAIISNGAKGQWSTVASNSDVVYRANDGLRSMLLDQTNFQAWGKPPYSFEVSPILALDNFALLNYESAIVFNNRLLHTVNPQQSAQGVYHTGIIPLNYDPISGLRGKAPAVYDSGVWIGSGTTSQMQVFQLSVGEVGGVERAFALVLNTTASPNQIEFWEILQDDAQTYDNDGTNNIPIPWQFDSASLRFSIPKNTHVCQMLTNGEIWVDDLVGTVSIQTFYKQDQFPAFSPWRSWQSQQTVDSSGLSQPAFLPRQGLGEPNPGLFDKSTGRPMRQGFTYQFRLKVVGHFVFLGAFFESQTVPIPKFAPVVFAPLT